MTPLIYSKEAGSLDFYVTFSNCVKSLFQPQITFERGLGQWAQVTPAMNSTSCPDQAPLSDASPSVAWNYDLNVHGFRQPFLPKLQAKGRQGAGLRITMFCEI